MVEVYIFKGIVKILWTWIHDRMPWVFKSQLSVDFFAWIFIFWWFDFLKCLRCFMMNIFVLVAYFWLKTLLPWYSFKRLLKKSVSKLKFILLYYKIENMSIDKQLYVLYKIIKFHCNLHRVINSSQNIVLKILDFNWNIETKMDLKISDDISVTMPLISKKIAHKIIGFVLIIGNKLLQLTFTVNNFEKCFWKGQLLFTRKSYFICNEIKIISQIWPLSLKEPHYWRWVTQYVEQNIFLWYCLLQSPLVT